MIASKDSYDVVILGGGLAGLSLAIHLKRERPETSILVVEKRKHPAPEAAFKVGEATVEISGHYFRNIVGVAEHLEEGQLRKAGLRFFFTKGDNRDIFQRREQGPSIMAPPETRTHQLDRGRLENFLGTEAVRLGAEFRDDCRVQKLTLSEDGQLHHVKIQQGTETMEVTGRWVVDASGPAGLIKRQLGLEVESPHAVNSVWWRVAKKIDVDDWCDEPEWLSRIDRNIRWLSTIHFTGTGYWFWIIPLGCGSTSLGIVADPDFHPFNEINRFDRAMDWLRKYEPQCAHYIEKSLGENNEHLQDFKVLKHFSHKCSRLFSTQRWGITGVAGQFHDPFYSPGSDFISYGNTFLVDLIKRDFQGEDLQQRTEIYNQFYMNIFDAGLHVYLGEYALMGNTRVFNTKVVFDTTYYWSVNCLLFYRNKLTDIEFLSTIGEFLQRSFQFFARVQAFFLEWHHALGIEEQGGGFTDIDAINFMLTRQRGMAANLNDDELRAKLLDNQDLLETIVAEMFRRVSNLKPGHWSADDPLAQLAATKQPRADVEQGLKLLWEDWYDSALQPVAAPENPQEVMGD